MIKIKKGDTIVPGTKIHLLSVKRKKKPAGAKTPSGQETTPGFTIESYQIIRPVVPAVNPSEDEKKKKK